MLVRNIDVVAGAGPATVRVGDVVVVLRRVGERSVNVAINAPREVQIKIEPQSRSGNNSRD